MDNTFSASDLLRIRTRNDFGHSKRMAADITSHWHRQSQCESSRSQQEDSRTPTPHSSRKRDGRHDRWCTARLHAHIDIREVGLVEVPRAEPPSFQPSSNHCTARRQTSGQGRCFDEKKALHLPGPSKSQCNRRQIPRSHPKITTPCSRPENNTDSYRESAARNQSNAGTT